MTLWQQLRERLDSWRGVRRAGVRHDDVRHKPAQPAAMTSRVAVAFDSSAHTWLFRIARDREAISEFCACLDKRLPPDYASADTLRAFQVTFDELLTNVVMHADGPLDEAVEILLRRDADAVTAVLRYRASAYDPTAYPHPDLDAPVMQRKVGGLGVHLARQLMRRFEHRYDAGCNEITLVRNRVGP